MSDHDVHSAGAECCCGPIQDAASQACEACGPKMYLTPLEEAILARMREIKDYARGITARLKEIEVQFQGEASEVTGSPLGEEWKELRTRLDLLRVHWKEWEQKLDNAIEEKLIALGHRERKA